VTALPLVRPSQLARFWELHPRTVHSWIRQGRLGAIRSPGNHFRVPPADIRAFCEREGKPVPPFVAPRPRRVIVATASATLRQALVRTLKSAVEIETVDDPYEAIVAASTSPAELLALGIGAARFDAPAAIRALKRSAAAATLTVVAYGITIRAQAEALELAGAARSLPRAQTLELPSVLRELLGLDPP
jgi:excisionase family DNA binding protein